MASVSIATRVAEHNLSPNSPVPQEEASLSAASKPAQGVSAVVELRIVRTARKEELLAYQQLVQLQAYASSMSLPVLLERTLVSASVFLPCELHGMITSILETAQARGGVQ